MKTHTNNFKNNLIKFGRDFNDLVTYNGTALSNEDLISFNISYKSSLMKSVMKELKIDTKLNLQRGGIINYQLGLKVGNSYEYIPYGNFIVEKVEEQKDKRSWLVTCYDKMLYTMVDYEPIREYQVTEDTTFEENKTYYQLTNNEYVEYDGDTTGNPHTLGLYEIKNIYPITIKEYLKKICNKLGIAFKDETFINYDKEITSERYVDESGSSLGYTFRDVLDDIAEVTGSNIIINSDDELELKYIENTAPLGTIYGNTTQTQTSGKNIFPIIANNEQQGVTLTYNESDGSYTLNGTATASYNFTLSNYSLKAGDYTIQCKYSGSLPSNSQALVQLYQASPYFNVIVSNNATNGAVTNATLSADGNVQVRIRIDNGFNYQNVKIFPMLVKGTYTTQTIGDFEKYTYGPTPNPYYPQPINVVTGGNVISVNNGDNLFDINWLSGEGITIEDGVVSATATTFRTTFSLNGAFIPNTNYGNQIAISVDGYTDAEQGTSSNNGLRFVINYTDGSTQNVLQFLNNDTTKTTKTAVSNASKMVKSLSIIYGNQPNNTWHLSNIMITYGNEVQPYKEYVGKSYEINLGKNLLTGFTKGIGLNATNGTQTTNTNAATTDYIPVDYVKNSCYYISGLVEGLYSWVGAYNSNKVFLGRISGTFRKATPLTATGFYNGTPQGTGDIVYLRVTQYVQSGGTGVIDDIDNAKIQLEVGAQQTSFSPYKTPIELCKINDYVDIIDKSSGINMFDLKSYLDSCNVTYTENSDGSITFSPTTYVYQHPFEFSSENTNVSLSGVITQGTIVNFKIKVLDSSNTVLGSLTNSVTKVENKNGCKLQFDWGTSGSVTLKNIMLNKGTTAFEYEPYGTNWYIKKSIGKVVLDGSENWGLTSSSVASGTKRFYYNDTQYFNDKNVSSNIVYCLSNMFKGIGWTSMYSTDTTTKYAVCLYCDNTGLGRINLRIEDTIASDVTTLKSWLGTNKPIVYYVLNTPTYTIITDTELVEQLDRLRMATSYGDNTNILISGSGERLTIDSDTFVSDYIDEEFFNDTNVTMGKKYGPINSLVFSRSADSDNIFRQDETSIEKDGLCELKISDNQLLNDNDRDNYIDDLFNYLNGLEYYLNDYDSRGILYYEVGDLYNAVIFGKAYRCIMFNDEVNRNPGVKESIYTEEPDANQSDYKKADTTDRKINQTTLIVNKQEGYIEGLVTKTNQLDTQSNNYYQELKGQFNDYTPLSRTVTIENSVQTLQTDTYTKTQIDTKLTDGSVTKVMTASGTYDINGMTYEKSKAQTKSIINEVGLGVKKTDGSEDYILFAGYVDNNNTQFSDFRGQTLVASENMLVRHYLVVGSKSRMEDYENGTGMFYIGG